jgi:hypothetical protein
MRMIGDCHSDTRRTSEVAIQIVLDGEICLSRKLFRLPFGERLACAQLDYESNREPTMPNKNQHCTPPRELMKAIKLACPKGTERKQFCRDAVANSNRFEAFLAALEPISVEERRDKFSTSFGRMLTDAEAGNVTLNAALLASQHETLTRIAYKMEALELRPADISATKIFTWLLANSVGYDADRVINGWVRNFLE